MENYAWPGNIRQLQNMLYQFLTLGRLELLEHKQSFVQEESRDEPAFTRGAKQLKPAVAEFEKEFITRTLAEYPKCEIAAEILGMNRKTLYRKMKRYGIKKR